MVYLVKYGIAFSLSQKRKKLDEKEALTVIETAAKKVGINSKNIGCSFDKGKLIPSADFMALNHLKIEFTAAVLAQEIKIKRIPQKRS
jgi:hypothetical protein